MSALHNHTPTLSVNDPRRLPVQSVMYGRSVAGEHARQCINSMRYDLAGRLIAQWDPRLHDLHKDDPRAPPNLVTVYSLSDQTLSTQSVDAGVRVQLFGEAKQGIYSWDGRGTRREVEFDLLMRPLAVFEQGLCAERFTYAGSSAEHNQCGQIARHDDPAGTRHFNEYTFTGAVLEQTQHFLQALDPPDWPLPSNLRDDLLEPGDGARTLTHFNALGEMVQQVDAAGNLQGFDCTLSGQLSQAWLKLEGSSERSVVASAITYDARGQMERKNWGNGVVSQFDYCPQDGRLLRLHSRGSSGEPLQDLHYAYDPVGNIVSIEDKTLPVRFFANQRIDPINRYTYDTRYQLIEATGFEAGSARQGPHHVTDPAAVANYRQIYRYDLGGNLLELIHHGPQSHGRVLTAARYSNRCLPERDGVPPTEDEIAAAFDANGNLLALEKGRMLVWSERNQLARVHPVQAESSLNDSERYIYGGGGLRQRKVHMQHTRSRTLVREVRYLPGLEVHIDRDVAENYQVVGVEVGHCRIEVSYRGHSDIHFSYPLIDHLRSCTTELDADGSVIVEQTYHPFGTTAFHKQHTALPARHHRYSAKEQDLTGLYYFGQRYYVPWQQRWSSADPAGVMDGLNLYCMVANRPLVFRDSEGRVREQADGMMLHELPESANNVTVPSVNQISTFPPNATAATSLSAAPDVPATADESVKPRWTIRRYLSSIPPEQRTLVVGCGATPEGTTVMGFSGTPCSLGHHHESDFTVDIDSGAHPDLTFDFTLYKGTGLGRMGAKQFQTVSFEYLSRGPRHPFKEQHFELWINAADELLAPGGEVLFYNAHGPYLELSEKALEKKGYSVNRKSVTAPGAHESIRGAVYVVGKKPGKGLASSVAKWVGFG